MESQNTVSVIVGEVNGTLKVWSHKWKNWTDGLYRPWTSSAYMTKKAAESVLKRMQNNKRGKVFSGGYAFAASKPMNVRVVSWSEASEIIPGFDSIHG